MRCGNCGNDAEDRWKYCPRCGAALRDVFSIADMFKKMHKDMGSIETDMKKAFQKNFEVLDLSPMFRNPERGSGFSIKIISNNRNPPKISVKTFGNVDSRNLEKQIYEQFGVKHRIPEKPAQERPAAPSERPEEAPKSTEEPETELKKFGSRVVASISLPGVKSPNDIRISDLENSVEVRATVGDKAFFKILRKPANARLIDKRFEKEKLIMEFA